MSITLGPVTFDDSTTAVKEKLEEVGGRDERRITISGIVTGLSTDAFGDALVIVAGVVRIEVQIRQPGDNREEGGPG